MKSPRTIAAIASVLFALMSVVQAQLPINNSWTLTMVDGSPVAKGVEVGVDIVGPDEGSYTGNVWFDKGDGQTPVPPEQMTITPLYPEPGAFLWENARGNAGVLRWSALHNGYISTVTSGSNKGQKRLLTEPK